MWEEADCGLMTRYRGGLFSLQQFEKLQPSRWKNRSYNRLLLISITNAQGYTYNRINVSAIF